MIDQIHIEDIEFLPNNTVIKSLKCLYYLDNEIDFTPNKEKFWTNLELISKLVSSKYHNRQIEAMKIIPFVYPFNTRITVISNYFQSFKKQKLANYYNQHHGGNEFEEEDYHTSVAFKVSRNSMFDQTLMLYLENKLLPYVPWKITFINEFNIVEDGGK